MTDALGREHEIVIEKSSGEVVYHDQPKYATEPENRTDKNNEYFSQARDYARWYVGTSVESIATPWYLNTDSLEQVRSAISACGEESLREHFWDYYRQLAGEYNRDITQPADDRVPRGTAVNEYREYKLDIYLGETGDIEATSGIHTMYYADVNDSRLVEGEDPYPDRRPDGRLEHVVIDLDWADFPEFLEYHLRCQIRDSYLARGEEPPEEYRVLGPGTDHAMVRYMTRDHLPDYHDYNASVDGYRAEDTFNAGPFGQILNLF